MTVADALTLIKRRGARVTRARTMLVGELITATAPLTAEELGKRLQKRRVFIDRATVYRELRFLERLHFVESVRLDSRREYFEQKRAHHHHAVCVRCGVVADVVVDEKMIAAATRVLRTRKSFATLRHTVDFFGLCARCRRDPAGA